MKPALLLSMALLCIAALAGRAEETPTAPPEAVKIGDDLYRLGKVKVDLKNKVLTCTGKINQRTMVIEYLAVVPGGKRHESLLLLNARPLHLQLGLILLGLEPKGGLRYQGDTQVPQGSPVKIFVSWTRSGKTVKVPAEELVWDMLKKRPMEPKAWVFSGSITDENGFAADRTLSLIGTYRDPEAVINNGLPNGADDAAYKPNVRILPPLGTPVTVTMMAG
jgi:hypothetical protein